jgi:hypothetical protein
MRFLSWLVDGVVGLIVALAGYTSAAEGGTAAAVVRRWLSRLGSWIARFAHWVWRDVPNSPRRWQQAARAKRPIATRPGAVSDDGPVLPSQRPPR